MRFHVLGLGSVGSLLSYHLRRTLPEHHYITLIHRTQGQASAAHARGGEIRIEVNGVVTAATAFTSEAFNPPDDTANRFQKIESLFITTKAHQTVPAIRRLLPRLSPNSTIVLLQNGMGVYEELTHHIFPNPATRPHFILASNTHGVFRKDTQHFVHAGLGGIIFGIVPDPEERNFEAGFQDLSLPKPDRAPRLSDISAVSDDERYKSLRSTVAALLLLEALNVSWKPMVEVQTAMRQKLVVNAILNPLTAIMGCRNGDVLHTASSRRIAERVCQEASRVFQTQFKADATSWLGSLESAGIDSQGVPIDRMPTVLTKSMLEDEVVRVAHLTKGNISSMLADIRIGKQTEIDFVNGYLLKLGRTYRVDMPATATLLNLVKMRSAIPLDQAL